MSKNMKSLSRLMVDRKLGVKQTNGNNKNYTATIATTAETSKENRHRLDFNALKKTKPLRKRRAKIVLYT